MWSSYLAHPLYFQYPLHYHYPIVIFYLTHFPSLRTRNACMIPCSFFKQNIIIFSLRNLTCNAAESIKLQLFQDTLKGSVKNISESKALIRNQLGLSKPIENVTCTENGNQEEEFALETLFSMGNWKFDGNDTENLDAVISSDASTTQNVLNFAVKSQQIWDVHCLMCDGESMIQNIKAFKVIDLISKISYMLEKLHSYFLY